MTAFSREMSQTKGSWSRRVAVCERGANETRTAGGRSADGAWTVMVETVMLTVMMETFMA